MGSVVPCLPPSTAHWTRSPNGADVNVQEEDQVASSNFSEGSELAQKMVIKHRET
jgi:hypothetical protein